MTEKLYYQDAYQKEFDATVLSCDQEGKDYKIVLDKTHFYPEGGGQGCDYGQIDTIPVTNVQEKDGNIYHYIKTPVQPGKKIHGVIDWDRRFDFMQQHSGEHIVSGMICSTCNCDNTGFHLGNELITIDYNTEITWEQILEIEKRANEYIYENHELEVLYPSKEELANISYRSKKQIDGQVRLTRFPGADICACCGTHVSSSGQVGIVKFISIQKFRDGVRLELLCGKRAYAYLSTSFNQNQEIGKMLSVKNENTYQAVEKIKDENQQLKNRISELEEISFEQTAKQYEKQNFVLHIEAGLSPDSTRRLCDKIVQTTNGFVACFSGEDSSYRYAIIDNTNNISAFVKDMNQSLSGRGGGKPNFCQGSVQATKEQILAYFEKAKKENH